MRNQLDGYHATSQDQYFMQIIQIPHFALQNQIRKKITRRDLYTRLTFFPTFCGLSSVKQRL